MSRIGSRFLTMFSILLGLTAAALSLLWLGRWLVPGIFGTLPGWLPEDTLFGLGFQTLSNLLQALPALTFSAIVLTFSYGIKPEELPGGETGALVRFSVLAIVSTVAFAVCALLVQPWVDARLGDLEFRQTQTRQLEDEYLRIKDLGSSHQTAANLEARLTLLKRLGILRPEQNKIGGHERMDYDFELQILKAHFDLDEFFKLRALPGVERATDEGSTTVEELLNMAEEALADGTDDREYQANLWGILAFRRLTNAVDQGKEIDPKLWERTRTVVDQSWARIYEKTLAADERKKASYFFRKGKSLGDFQFQNYLEAFYGFQELHSENPRDPEVTKHWELSRERASEQVLFSQEMEVLFAVPGSRNLVFLNRENPTEVIRIGKLLNTSQGVFLKDFEFLRVSDQGEILLHWTAPFGRWGEKGIDFRVWDKERPESHFPVILKETPGNEFNPLGTVDPPLFEPRVSVRDLEAVNNDQPRPQTLGTMDLQIHGQAIEALGYNATLFQTEFVARLAAPFVFFVAFLLVFAFAWTNRAHEPGRTWWFLVPVLPLVAEFVVQTSAWASRLLVGGSLKLLGLNPTVAAIGILFVGGSIVGLLLTQRAFLKSLHRV